MKDWINRNGVTAVIVAFILGALIVYLVKDTPGYPIPMRDRATVATMSRAPMAMKAMDAEVGYAAAAPMMGGVAMAEAAVDNAGMPARTIAYSYFWSIQVKDRNAMKSRIDELTQKCNAAGDKCELQNASITSDRIYPNASFAVRVAPELITEFKNIAMQNGSMLSDNKSSGQMADQIMDVEKRLGVKEAYLQRLDELSKSPGNLDDVMRLQQEISNTVAEIESLRSQARGQQKQVQKEVININYQVPPPATASTEPVARAFQDFGRNMGQSAAQMIDIVARLLPWILVLFVIAYVGRGVATNNWSLRCRHKNQ